MKTKKEIQERINTLTSHRDKTSQFEAKSRRRMNDEIDVLNWILEPSKVETTEYVLGQKTFYLEKGYSSGVMSTNKDKARTFPTLEQAMIHNTDYLNGEFTPEPINKPQLG